MKALIIKDVKFKFAQQGYEQGIEIHYGNGFEFWSCRRGTDLMDFDALLEYFIPEIDFERITYAIAREWEERLYRELSQCTSQVGARKALSNFLQQMRSSYGKQAKRGQALKKLPAENLIHRLDKTFTTKTRLHPQALGIQL